MGDCYDDLADHIFAVETGLSSDPQMNWRVSSLDRYRLISNSDAHSPAKLGREACLFETDLNYFSLKKGLETGQGFVGTVEFFPEEGKYHLDGHRKCGVRFTPQESLHHDNLCPTCRKPLTLGVLHRVDVLADRPKGKRPHQAHDFSSLIPLPEILSEILGVGPASKRVGKNYESLLNTLGSEFDIFWQTPIEEIRNKTSELLAEAIHRMRKGQVIREAGFDGEFGTIKLFEKNELKILFE